MVGVTGGNKKFPHFPRTWSGQGAGSEQRFAKPCGTGNISEPIIGQTDARDVMKIVFLSICDDRGDFPYPDSLSGLNKMHHNPLSTGAILKAVNYFCSIAVQRQYYHFQHVRKFVYPCCYFYSQVPLGVRDKGSEGVPSISSRILCPGTCARLACS